jgi:uncharacterized protein YbaP (TraB family)
MRKNVFQKPLFLLVLCLLGLPVLRAEEKCFLWKVTKDGNTAYLLGSVHVATPDMYPLPKELYTAFDECKALAVEADVEKVNMAEMQAIVMKKGLYAGADTLSKKLSKESADALKAYMEKSGGALMMFEKMKPWLVGITISMLEIQKLGFQPDLGIDKHFLDKARDKKKILELESASFQIDLLSGFTDEQQDKFLRYTLAEVEHMKDEMTAMITAWKKGDAAGLHDVSHKAVKKYPDLVPVMKSLIDDRNVKMAEKVEGYMKSGESTFVIAGALHMTGDQGLVSLLIKKGYTVEQISKK